MRADPTYGARERGNEDPAVNLHAWPRGGSGPIAEGTALWTRWRAAAFVGQAVLALVACEPRAD